MQIEIRLYATLRQHAPPGTEAGVFRIEAPEGASLADVIEMVGISPAKVHMRMVNGTGVNENHILKDSDRVGLFPPIGGG